MFRLSLKIKKIKLVIIIAKCKLAECERKSNFLYNRNTFCHCVVYYKLLWQGKRYRQLGIFDVIMKKIDCLHAILLQYCS